LASPDTGLYSGSYAEQFSLSISSVINKWNNGYKYDTK